MFQQVLIVGVGLLGSSLALALKKYKLAKKIVGCSRSRDTIRTALKLGIIQGGSTSPEDFVKDSGLVVFCVPLSIYSTLAEKISGFLKHDAIITDVGSVKQFVANDVMQFFSPKQRSFFVPGHPIAGSEITGPEAGTEDMFEGRRVILTPIEQTNKQICGTIENMWSELGARVSYMTPAEHDKIFAYVSHAPQFLAYTYRYAFPDQVNNNDPTFKKFFRIANSAPKIWFDIFSLNKKNILKSIRKFREEFLKEIGNIEDTKPLPRLISNSMFEVAKEYKEQAGQGFLDFTSARNHHIKCEQTISDAPNFIASLDTMTAALEKDMLEKYLFTNQS